MVGGKQMGGRIQPLEHGRKNRTQGVEVAVCPGAISLGEQMPGLL